MKKVLRFFGSPRFSKQGGMALVVTLSIIVLLTIAVMAFFARSMSNRTIEASRSNQILATQIADSAVDYVTSGFLQEIMTNSTRYGSDGTTASTTEPFVYQPTTNAFAVPQRPLPSTIASNTNFALLIRRSVNEITNNIGETNASPHNTATASRNGRTVGAARWNAPYLLTGQGFTDANQLPNWIYVNGDGTMTASPSTNAIGRFAYNVYDIGGLLDANVAGYPSSVTGTNLSTIKGTPAGADLSVIPGITDANAFATWRNSGSAGNYTTTVTNSATNGFLRSAAGDNRIADRQDLINLARTGACGISTNALPYFTSFARFENTPNWTPKINAGNGFNYKNNANAANSINRNLPNVRVKNSFPRRDGSTSVVGEPLLKTRFPLNKLSLLDSTNPGTAADILAYFGLTQTSDGWTYNHGDPKNILTLNQVAQQGREPDFFELLKAVILSGSLGRDPGVGSASINVEGPLGNGFEAYSSSTDMQILQIGANIIDQYDTDSYPTAIYFDQISDTSSTPKIMKTVYGVENLPYLHQLNQIFYLTDNEIVTNPPTDYPNLKGKVAFWLQPVIWNPHVPRETTTKVPQNFRINTYGSLQCAVSVTVWNTDSPPKSQRLYVDGYPLGWQDYIDGWMAGNPVRYDGSSSEGKIVFPLATADSAYSEPVPLTPANAVPNATSTIPGGNALGISGGTSYSSMQTTIQKCVGTANFNALFNPSTYGSATYKFLGSLTDVYFGEYLYPINDSPSGPGFSFVLEYQDASGNWKPYSHMARINHFGASGFMLSPMPFGNMVHVDPRTDRFSVSQAGNSQSSPGDSTNLDAGRTMRSSSTQAAYAGKSTPWHTSGFTYNPAYAYLNWNAILYGDLFQNLTSGSAYYADLDGVVRPADGAEANLSTGDGCPIYVGGLSGSSAARRSIILNRPFRSVGELGYVFRDQPYFSLNFSASASGDLGILDVFTVDEEPEVGAGKVNPNRAPAEVLAAIFLRGISQEMPAVSQIRISPVDDALAVGRGIRDWIMDNGPLTDREDLAKAVGTAIRTANLTTAQKANKNLREAFIRAISPNSDLRTWNLFIDVVAQTGRFSMASVNGGDFDVQGEKRYWLHIAIDRLTGKILGKNLESVGE